MKSLLSLNKYFWRYKYLLIAGFFCVALTMFFRVSSPEITRYITNEVVAEVSNKENLSPIKYHGLVKLLSGFFKDKTTTAKIIYSGITLIVIAIISGIFMFLMRQTIIVMSRKIEYDQKNDLFNLFLNLNQTFYKNNRTGDLMNRMAEDVSRVRMYTGPALMYFINLLVTIIFCLYNMFNTHVGMSLVSLTPLPFLAITIYYVNTIINKKGERVQVLLSDITTKAQENYSGIRVIKSFFKENFTSKDFNKSSEELKQANLSLAKTENMYFPAMAFIIGLSTVLTIFYAAWLINKGELNDIGIVPAFILYIQILTFPVSAIGWTASMIQRAAVSQKRIDELMNANSEIFEDKQLNKLSHLEKIEFKNVCFTYPETGIKALNNISFTLSKGKKLGIAGKTGSGKSSLINLLLMQYTPNQGWVMINDKDGADVNKNSFRQKIGYVPQENLLFSDTITNNLTIGLNNTVSEQEITHYAKIACVHNEIMDMPTKYNTIVGEKGITLSGGQKQRIGIARALIRKPELTIFDDCLSAVDAITEKNIIEHIQKELNDNMVLIVAHRLSALQICDEIIVLENGSIVERGTHEQLLSKEKSWYKEQWIKQNS